MMIIKPDVPTETTPLQNGHPINSRIQKTIPNNNIDYNPLNQLFGHPNRPPFFGLWLNMKSYINVVYAKVIIKNMMERSDDIIYTILFAKHYISV
jgi:hypothetical protein